VLSARGFSCNGGVWGVELGIEFDRQVCDLAQANFVRSFFGNHAFLTSYVLSLSFFISSKPSIISL